MAENTIKDFVKKQTTPLSIGIPKQRPQETVQEVRMPEPEPKAVPTPAPAPVVDAIQVKNPVGRPRSNVQKVKMSVYVPEEAKAKLIRIQHTNFKQNLNDILLEAIYDIIKKYAE